VIPTDYLRAVRRRWALVLAAVILAVGAGGLAGGGTGTPAEQEQPEGYRAETLLLSSGSVGARRSAEESLATISVLATVGEVPERVIDDTGFQGTRQELLDIVQVQGDSATGLLRISATSNDPEEAELLANTYAEELLDFLQDRWLARVEEETALIRRQTNQLDRQIRQLDSQIASADAEEQRTLQSERDALFLQRAQLQSTLNDLASSPYLGRDLEIIQEATAEPAEPAATGFEPPESPLARMGLAGLLGLVIGVALALFLERFDTRVRTKEGAEDNFGAPVLAEVPVLSMRDRKGIASSASQAADAFRLLGVGLLRAAQDRDGESGAGDGHPGKAIKVVLVTSPGPGEGKSTVVANLAATYAESGRNVLVISCDLRRPSIHRFLEVPEDSGLVQLLYSENGEVPLAESVRKTSIPGVEVVPSGVPMGAPGRLLSSGRMRQVLDQARRRADVVLLDSPSILTASDISHLLPEVDAVLLVARAGRTTAQVARRATEILERLGAPVVGVALNGATESPQPKGTRHYRNLAAGGLGDDLEPMERTPGLDEPTSGSGEWR
jgi:capsular exopolysaccharide synthesis family protein